MAKKSQSSNDRRAKLEEMREQQRSADRRRTILVVTAALVVGGGLVAAAAVPLVRSTLNDPANKDWSEFGVAAAEASCEPVEETPPSGEADHRPDGEVVSYESVPPASGPHYAVPAPFTRKFYTPADAPEVERLVHNLEHGYAVVWYDPAVLDEQEQTLRDLAVKTADSDDTKEETAGKVVVAPWDPERGEFPEGKAYALTRWGAEQSYRQYCGELSGEAVRDFVQAYPSSDAPEPFGA
ncbi:MAG TPA: DUF3105 domain-containing protein [Jiangellales bacterium]|nr:DUF3105 domain-containing protein [Jiangellales bacterium]